MKKLMLFLCLISILVNIQAQTVLFNQPGTPSYEALAEQANAKNPAALKTLSTAWQQPNGDAANFGFIGDYLIKQGLSASQVTAKLSSVPSSVPIAPPMGTVPATPPMAPPMGTFPEAPVAPPGAPAAPPIGAPVVSPVDAKAKLKEHAAAAKAKKIATLEKNIETAKHAYNAIPKTLKYYVARKKAEAVLDEAINAKAEYEALQSGKAYVPAKATNIKERIAERFNQKIEVAKAKLEAARGTSHEVAAQKELDAALQTKQDFEQRLQEVEHNKAEAAAAKNKAA
ncbi:MAG: hypothetical protein P4L22_01530 [Candidatus Babeliales bacterium]|nr:hypothetical protein [Candidatus Babeliales bacterium]